MRIKAINAHEASKQILRVISMLPITINHATDQISMDIHLFITCQVQQNFILKQQT